MQPSIYEGFVRVYEERAVTYTTTFDIGALISKAPSKLDYLLKCHGLIGEGLSPDKCWWIIQRKQDFSAHSLEPSNSKRTIKTLAVPLPLLTYLVSNLPYGEKARAGYLSKINDLILAHTHGHRV